VVDVQPVQQRQQALPQALLNGLAAVVAETDMNGAGGLNAVENVIESLDGPGNVLGVAGISLPSTLPRIRSLERSGCGIMPRTFLPSLRMPAMFSSEPFGFSLW
jgi:hypothetical protein